MMRGLAVAIVVGCAGSGIWAQDVDCNNAMTQRDMNICAHLDWQAADADLNRAYVIARKALQQIDHNLPENQRGAANALRNAQRAWITFRDKACEAEGFLVRGGSLEPLFVSTCRAHLTRQRSEALLSLAEHS